MYDLLKKKLNSFNDQLLINRRFWLSVDDNVYVIIARHLFYISIFFLPFGERAKKNNLKNRLAYTSKYTFSIDQLLERTKL